MLKKVIKIAALCVAALVAVALLLIALFLLTRPEEPIDQDTNVGLIEKSFTDTTRNRVLNAYVWFPTADTIEPSLTRSNALFYGFSARPDATPALSQAPLIILSHGSGGNNGNQGWLAVSLAKLGAVVVAANHPGSTSRDSAPHTNIQMWERPKDISFVIDEILKDTTFGPLIDQSRIAAVGHSLGGYTVLASGGGVISKAAFIDYCDTYPANPDCVFYKNGGVDLLSVNQSDVEQSHKDERINALVVIDPAYGRSFEASSLSTLPPMLLITPKVEQDTIDDLQIGYLRDQLVSQQSNGVENLIIDGAHHFSFLPRCKPYASYVLGLVEKGAEVLCLKEDGIDRTKIHSTTVEAVVQFFKANSILD